MVGQPCKESILIVTSRHHPLNYQAEDQEGDRSVMGHWNEPPPRLQHPGADPEARTQLGAEEERAAPSVHTKLSTPRSLVLGPSVVLGLNPGGQYRVHIGRVEEEVIRPPPDAAWGKGVLPLFPLVLRYIRSFRTLVFWKWQNKK